MSDEPEGRRPVTRSLNWENVWGECGDLMLVFGHVDRSELVAAAARYEIEEGSVYPDDPSPTITDSRHAYGVLDPWAPDQPYLHYQELPEHHDGEVVPITVVMMDGESMHVALLADLDRSPWAPAPPPLSTPAPADPLADRLISKVVHRG